MLIRTMDVIDILFFPIQLIGILFPIYSDSIGFDTSCLGHMPE